MKICKNCKHNGDTPFGSKEKWCDRPIGVSLVHGTTKTVDNFCSIERNGGFFWCRIMGSCGKEGRFFEEKDK